MTGSWTVRLYPLSGFIKLGRDDGFLDSGMKLAKKVRERLIILVIVETSTDEHYLRSQMGMGSKPDCLFGHLDRIL